MQSQVDQWVQQGAGNIGAVDDMDQIYQQHYVFAVL